MFLMFIDFFLLIKCRIQKYFLFIENYLLLPEIIYYLFISKKSFLHRHY